MPIKSFIIALAVVAGIAGCAQEPEPDPVPVVEPISEDVPTGKL